MLTPRWHKVIRDLCSQKTKTVLIVLAIAIGLFAFGSVFVTQEVLLREMDTQYRSTDTANIVFYTSYYDSNLLRWVRQQPEVADAQGRASYTVKLLAGEKTYNLSLYAYPDNGNISVNRITPEDGRWPPARKEISFERASLPLSLAEIGDKVLVELPNGKQYELIVAGTVHDLNAFPGTMIPMPTAYVSFPTLEWMGFPGDCNQIHIVSADRTLNRLENTRIAADFRLRLADKGVPVYSTQIRDSGDHWAKDVVQSFSLILGGLGIFSLVLSGFLVVNTITALVTQQKRQIGIMKAVGGTGGQIISLYLALVGFYGLLALVIALPVSLGLSYFFLGIITDFLNIDIARFYMPPRVLFLEAGAAIVVPAVAAALPILGGVRITVREALSSYGIAARTRTGLFDRILFRVRIFSRPVLLSLRNTFRRRGRLALTLGTLTLAGTLFIGVMNIRASLESEFDNLWNHYYNWQVALNLESSYPRRWIESRIMSIPGVVRAESQNGGYAQRIMEDGSQGTSFNITGVSPESESVRPELSSGRWLEAGDQNVLVLTSALAKDLPDIKTGDTVTLKLFGVEREWEIIGIAPQTFDRVAYSSFDNLARLRGSSGLTSEVYISTADKDGASQTRIAEAIESQLKQDGIRVSGSLTQETIASANSQQISLLIYFLLVMAVMSAAIGALGLMGMMSLNVMERTREIGVMRSIGATSRAVGSIVITEGLIIGFISWLAAIPVSIPMSLIFNSMLGSVMFGAPLDFVFSPQGLIIWLAIIVCMALAASLLPAYNAMRMSVRETLAYE